MTGGVAVVGSLNIDVVVGVERIPEPGETLLGESLVRLPGGKGANQALAAARAGASVHLVGRVGDDPDGQTYLAGLTANGVDCAHVQQMPDRPTGTALITVDRSGENTIVVAAGANAEVRPEDVDRAAPAVTAADVLLVQLEIPLETVIRAVEIAHHAGVRVVLNPSPVRDLPPAVVDAADPMVLNEHEERRLRPDPDRACVTRGAGPATWATAVSTPRAVETVDATGAGDVFAGTLAARLADDQPPAGALDGAVAAATEATTWSGAQGWRLG